MMYFIAYDIADRKRLQKTAKILENYGIRVQYSFFQCELEKTQMGNLKNALTEVLDKKCDSLHIYPICEDCLKKTSIIGNGSIFVPARYEIL